MRTQAAQMVQKHDLDGTVAYLFSALSLAFLFLSAATHFPLPHCFGLLLLPKAFFENAENQARHQNQNDHNDGPDRPHGNCGINSGEPTCQCQPSASSLSMTLHQAF